MVACLGDAEGRNKQSPGVVGSRQVSRRNKPGGHKCKVRGQRQQHPPQRGTVGQRGGDKSKQADCLWDLRGNLLAQGVTPSLFFERKRHIKEKDHKSTGYIS